MAFGNPCGNFSAMVLNPLLFEIAINVSCSVCQTQAQWLLSSTFIPVSSAPTVVALHMSRLIPSYIGVTNRATRSSMLWIVPWLRDILVKQCTNSDSRDIGTYWRALKYATKHERLLPYCTGAVILEGNEPSHECPQVHFDRYTKCSVIVAFTRGMSTTCLLLTISMLLLSCTFPQSGHVSLG